MAITITVTFEQLVAFVQNAVRDLGAAIEQYPDLVTFLNLARSGLDKAISLARVAETPRAGFFLLRGAAAIASGTLADVRKRHPTLEATSSLICDVEYGLRDVSKFTPSVEVR